MSVAVQRRLTIRPQSPSRLPVDAVVSLGRFILESGHELSDLQVAYTCIGPRSAPVIAIAGGISADRYVSHPNAVKGGWWSSQVGDGRALDTSRYRILCWDYLGGNGATTGPRNVGPKRFPDITSGDQARLLARLLEYLGIHRLYALVGASYGGMVALQFGARFSQQVARLLVISAAHKNAPMAIAWRTLQRTMVEESLRSGDGRQGLALARALAMATYRTADEFSQRFAGDPVAGPDHSAVWDYLSARGAAYAETMDPHAFLCLSRSIDLHRLTSPRLAVPLQLVAVHDDQLVPYALSLELAGLLGPNCELVSIRSIYGHDAFLKEDAQFNTILSSL